MKNFCLKLIFFSFSLVINLSSYAQESEYEKWQREKEQEYNKYKKESDEELRNFIKGWDNSFFDIEELASQEANTEAIIIDQPDDNTPNAQVSLPQSATSGIKLWAVVVGVSDYATDKLDLRYADDDAQTFARFLASPEGGGIPEDRLFMHIDEDAHHEAVHETLKEVFSRAGENDGIIFYFSGHGSPSAFVLHDYGKPTVYIEDGRLIKFVSETKGLLSHQYLNEAINNSKAKYKYCIIDACHSASMLETKSKNIAELSQLKGFYVELDKSKSGSVYILSSMGHEVSYENRVEEANLRGGYFTYFLIKGIRGEADYNNDSIITVVEAFDYTKRNVAAITKTKQNPAIAGQYSPKMPIGVVRK